MSRKKLKRGIIAALLGFAGATGAAALEWSRSDGDRLAQKIDQFHKNAKANPVQSKQTSISESEANSYLAFHAKEHIPRGLANPEIRMLGDGELAGRVFVDMDEFKRHRRSSGFLDPLNFISGQVPVTAQGTLRTQQGVGRFYLASAEIHGVPLPRPLVQELVGYFSRTPDRPYGFHIDEPFNLPAKIREITVHPREARIFQ